MARSAPSANGSLRASRASDTPGVAKTAHREAIYLKQRFSDHAPLVIDYRWKPEAGPGAGAAAAAKRRRSSS